MGNRGYTGGTFIKTSHIVMHTWDESPFKTLHLDIYTCGYLNPKTVIQMLSIFKPNKIYIKFLDRNTNLTKIPLSHTENIK